MLQLLGAKRQTSQTSHRPHRSSHKPHRSLSQASQKPRKSIENPLKNHPSTNRKLSPGPFVQGDYETNALSTRLMSSLQSSPSPLLPHLNDLKRPHLTVSNNQQVPDQVVLHLLAFAHCTQANATKCMRTHFLLDHLVWDGVGFEISQTRQRREVLQSPH